MKKNKGSKKSNNSRKRKERPITSFFESLSTTTTRALSSSNSSSSSNISNKASKSTATAALRDETRSFERLRENELNQKNGVSLSDCSGGGGGGGGGGGSSNRAIVHQTVQQAREATATSSCNTTSQPLADIETTETDAETNVMSDSTNKNMTTLSSSTTTTETSLSLSSQSDEEKKPKSDHNLRYEAILTSKTKNHVIHQLWKRSTRGGGGGSKGSFSMCGTPTPFLSNFCPSPPWKATSWIMLNQQQSSVISSSIHVGAPSAAVNHVLKWDHEGVLLATMSMNQRKLVIYDWDSVLAADCKGRNARLRFRQQQQEQAKNTEETNGNAVSAFPCFSVDPAMVIPLTSIGRTFQAIEWNPYNPDELALMHRDGFVDIYNLGQIADWQDDRGATGGTVPHKRIRTDIPPSGSPLLMLFVGKDTIVVGSGHQLACYSRLRSKTPLLRWTFAWNQRLSSLVPVNSTLIALGSTIGNICLLDWKRVQKASFARNSSPMLVVEWSTCRGLACPGKEWMGVYQLHAETGMTSHHQTTKHAELSSPNDLGRCKFSWFTACGWALSATMELSGKSTDKSQVHYATNCVNIVNSEGDQIGVDRKTWSLPAERVKGTGTTSVLCWETVADVTQVLAGGRDHRVLDGQSRTIRAQDAPALLWMPRSGGHVRTIPLSKRSMGLASVAIHPSHEWIVVSTDNQGLRIYNARNKV